MTHCEQTLIELCRGLSEVDCECYVENLQKIVLSLTDKKKLILPVELTDKELKDSLLRGSRYMTKKTVFGGAYSPETFFLLNKSDFFQFNSGFERNETGYAFLSVGLVDLGGNVFFNHSTFVSSKQVNVISVNALNRGLDGRNVVERGLVKALYEYVSSGSLL